jgi:hypothetical protein
MQLIGPRARALANADSANSERHATTIYGGRYDSHPAAVPTWPAALPWIGEFASASSSRAIHQRAFSIDRSTRRCATPSASRYDRGRPALAIRH